MTKITAHRGHTAAELEVAQPGKVPRYIRRTEKYAHADPRNGSTGTYRLARETHGLRARYAIDHGVGPPAVCELASEGARIAGLRVHDMGRAETLADGEPIIMVTGEDERSGPEKARCVRCQEPDRAIADDQDYVAGMKVSPDRSMVASREVIGEHEHPDIVRLIGETVGNTVEGTVRQGNSDVLGLAALNRAFIPPESFTGAVHPSRLARGVQLLSAK